MFDELLLMKIRNFIVRNCWTFIKYSIVGAAVTIIDVAGFTGLLRYTDLSRNLSATVSFVAAVINNYTFNRLWTYKSHDSKISKQFTKFLIVSIIGLGLNLFFLWVFSN
ncbi:MAG: GtrA family protein, partial [Planctomycetes bacterium]|nr:GtrA family protein [Planctomycetota bacterium]